ncbi:MAG: hypothetical protein HZB56_09975 [Deltaproteobacteria bacterium]|nr:hypothetical protein [Deltaproteobacteria bacterium]
MTRATAALAALLLATAARAEEPKKATAARAQLEKLKALAGTWKGKAGEPGSDKTFDAVVTYRVTGAGSAVVEIIGPGTPHEMVTVYHLDGDDLLLTHYCAAGNQPTMRAVKSDAPDVLAFDFLRGSNMKPTDVHMHSARIQLPGPDKVIGDWVSWQDGKPASTMRFDLARQK